MSYVLKQSLRLCGEHIIHTPENCPNRIYFSDRLPECLDFEDMQCVDSVRFPDDEYCRCPLPIYIENADERIPDPFLVRKLLLQPACREGRKKDQHHPPQNHPQKTIDGAYNTPVLYPCRQAGSRPVTGNLLFGAGGMRHEENCETRIPSDGL